ncbi:hypothetical protein CC79DRAFT_1318717 [Sarocladium strictum]
MDKFSRFLGFYSQRYHSARQVSECDYALPCEEDAVDSRYREKELEPVTTGTVPPQQLWLRLAKYTLLSLLFVLYSVALTTYGYKEPSDNECGRQVSLWSPLNEAIDYYEADLENEFDQQTIYRGPPTPELENAWDELWRIDPVAFPVDKLTLVNRSEGVLNGQKLARLGDGSEDAPVAANFEVFHQLHCLNYLRQYTWRDWYFRHPDKVFIPEDMLASDVGARMHADHCIEHLRLSLMCHADTTPFFTYIDASQPMGAKGDFSSHHKCRDFKKIQDLAITKQQPFGPWEGQ